MLGSAIPDSQFLRMEGGADREPCFRRNPDDSREPAYVPTARLADGLRGQIASQIGCNIG
jgi:hypothetical protein